MQVIISLKQLINFIPSEIGRPLKTFNYGNKEKIQESGNRVYQLFFHRRQSGGLLPVLVVNLRGILQLAGIYRLVSYCSQSGCAHILYGNYDIR